MSRQGELELQLAAALGSFWHLGGHLEEGRRRVVEALAACAGAPDELRGDALTDAGWMARKQGDLEDARALAEEAAACYRAADNARGLATSMNLLGVVALGAGEHEEARVLLEEAKSLREQLDDELALAATIHNLGLLASAQGDFEEATRQLEAGLILDREHNAEGPIANALGDLGFVALAQGRHDDARPLFAESLRLCTKLGWKEDSQYCFIGLAAVYAAEDDSERAACLIGAAETVGEEIQLKLEAYAEGVKEGAKRELVGRLGEEAFARYLGEGRAMSLDEAVACALGDDA
jgi:non-specific serine/threonine protein kinase